MRIMRLHKWGRKKIGSKIYTEYRTTPAYHQEALKALRADYKEVKQPFKQGKWIVILVRGSKY